MAKDQAAVEFLSSCPLFARFKPKELEALLGSTQRREFESGSTIVHDGDSGLGFYLVVEGDVEVRKGDRVLRRLGKGDFFGEMALLDGSPRSADVVALAPTTCLVVTSWDLHGLISRHPSMAIAMMGELARRLRETNQALTE